MHRIKFVFKNINPAKNFKLLLLTIFLAAPMISLAGTTYYVNGTTGSDSNPGTQSSPWKTIQKAANTLIAGDTVVVNPGTYSERVIVNKSGSTGSLLSITGDPNGEVKCQGFTVKGNYIRVKGFTVTATVGTWNPEGYGIWVEGDNCIIENNYAYYCPTGGIIATSSSASCVFRNNRCYRNCLAGIEINGLNHIIENNEIWRTITHHTPTNWTPSEDANGVYFFGSGHTFTGNYIHDISYSDPENQGYAPHIDAFQTWTDAWHVAATNVLIEKNLIILPDYLNSVARCHGFMFRDASYITIKNNIVIAHGGTETGARGGTCHHIAIINNTFVGRLDYIPSNSPFGISLENCPYSTIKNNIVYNQVAYAIYLNGTTRTGLDIGYNCTYNSDGIKPDGTPQPHDLWKVNPRFVDPANNNFHLQADSPCIDAGATLSGITDDYDGNRRPIGTKYDIGAFEFQADAPPKASFACNPNPGPLPVKVNYDASGSSDPDGQIVSYSWDFGDGGHGAGKIVSHSYAKKGTYTATLTVKDNFGLDKSSSQNVTIVATPVAIIMGGPTKGRALLSTAFNGSHSKSSQAGGRITSFTWDFGDGATATGNKVKHIYTTSGNFPVNLTVTDNTNKTQSKTMGIYVFSKPKAIFSYSPSIITPSTTVTFDGSVSYDKYEAIVSYKWSYGDGTTGTGSKTTHRFNKWGRNYTMNLTVTNVQGYANSLSKSIFVRAK